MDGRGHDIDYHGALVVIETANDEIVMIHPPGAPADAPASLPSNPLEPGEEPEVGAVRMAREMTGLDVEILEELVSFLQPGTPMGTMWAHGYRARVIGGSMIRGGQEGLVRAYPLDALPRIIPVRVANQRVLAACLEHKGRSRH